MVQPSVGRKSIESKDKFGESKRRFKEIEWREVLKTLNLTIAMIPSGYLLKIEIQGFTDETTITVRAGV